MLEGQVITIIIPMYNAENYVSETLDSLLSQTYNEWECIVVDDGSTDNSSKIVLGYCKKDKRIKYYKQDNAGPSKARNLGFEKSKGHYIQFLDADDVLSPNRFKLLLDAYMETESKAILYSDLLVGESYDITKTSNFSFKTTLGKNIDFKSMYKHFGNDLLFIPGCVLFPRNSLLNVKWNESLSHSEDWDYYLQITQEDNYYFTNFPKVLFLYRNTANSLSTNLQKIYKANYQILRKYRKLNNIFDYCRKVGFFLYRNLINYRNKNIAEFVSPIDFKSKSLFLSALLLPLSFIYCFLLLFLHKTK